MNRFHTAVLAGLTLMVFSTVNTSAQFKPNYDESKVPAYTLPDLLSRKDGRPVSSAGDWERHRRAEILELFETHVYGRSPGRPAEMKFEVRSEDRQALGGKATRKEVTVLFTGQSDGPAMDILIYLPNDAKGPAPLFIGLNFFGNHTVHSDPAITIPTSWMRSSADLGVVNNRATEAGRGLRAERWQVEKIIGRGFGLATIYCGDIEPDFAEGWKMGVRSVFRPGERGRPAVKADGPVEFAPDDWGCIAAWAWGLSRALDYFETDEAIDHGRVAVMGHSRLGKTSLWAGAADERFAIVISNNSGCGGAALSRRRFGETVERINTSFPHWFCGNFEKYNENESALPVDQHMLIALAAPRPAYVASAQEDAWADPRGEFLAAQHAGPVYELLGRKGVGVDEMPALNQPVGDFVGYHIRTGRHDVTAYDWEQYLSFGERHFGSE
jgi:hypothetical protein